MPDWPLPSVKMSQNISDARRAASIRTKVDMGPAKSRRLYSDSTREIMTTGIVLTKDERDTLMDFYISGAGLAEGARRFNWTDPATAGLAAFRFMEPPKLSLVRSGPAANKLWSADLKLELLPFTPLDLDIVKAWWDASDVSQVTLVGDHVSAIRDKTGRGYALSNPTESQWPLYDADAFNGLGSVLQVPADSTNLYTDASAFIFAEPYAISIAAKAIAEPGVAIDRGLFYLKDTNFLSLKTDVSSPVDLPLYRAATLGASVANYDGAQIITMVLNGANSYIRVNGTNYTVGTSPGGAPFQFFLGIFGDFSAGTVWNGYLGEVVVLDTADAAAIIANENYMMRKWGRSFAPVAREWPAALPKMSSDISDELAMGALRSSISSAEAIMRRRFTATTRAVETSIPVTGAQRQILDLFHNETLAEGALSFDWSDPVTGTAARLRFTAPIQYNLVRPGPVLERMWNADLKLEIMP